MMNSVLLDDPNLYQILYTEFLQTEPDAPVAFYGRNALHVASLTNKVQMVEHLLSASGLQGTGASVRAKTDSGKTALHYALVGNNAKIAGLLMDAGASPADVDTRGATPLQLGCKASSAEAVRLMLSRLDADISCTDEFGWTALHYAAENLYDDPGLVTMLLEAGAETDASSDDKQTPLHIAACANNVECIDALLAAHSTATEQGDTLGRTPLLCAAEHASVNATVLLLGKGANLQHRDESGQGFTDLATTSGGAVFVALFEVAKLLVAKVSLSGGSIVYPNLDPNNATLLFPVNVGVLAAHAKGQIVPRGKPSIVSISFTNSGLKPVLFKCSTSGTGVYKFDPTYGKVDAKTTKVIRVCMQLGDSRLLSEIKADRIAVQCISIDKPEMVDYKAEWFWCRIPLSKMVQLKLNITAKVSLATPGLMSV